MVARGVEIKPTQQALVARLHEIPAMILVCNLGLPPDATAAGQVGYFGSILPAAWSLMLAPAGEGHRHHLDLAARRPAGRGGGGD